MQEQLPVSGDEVCHRLATPYVAVQPEPTIHRVDHPVPAPSEFEVWNTRHDRFILRLLTRRRGAHPSLALYRSCIDCWLHTIHSTHEQGTGARRSQRMSDLGRPPPGACVTECDFYTH